MKVEGNAYIAFLKLNKKETMTKILHNVEQETVFPQCTHSGGQKSADYQQKHYTYTIKFPEQWKQKNHSTHC